MSPNTNSESDLSGCREKSDDGNVDDAPELRLPLTRQNSSLALSHLEERTVSHEMIVSYLYQQQRSRLWISDIDSTEEGAFMRESWSHYITAPILLSESMLAEALIDLNAEVGNYQWKWKQTRTCILGEVEILPHTH
jgi:hypothetical protein